MGNIYQITSFLHAPDMVESLKFFCDVLTSELKARHSNYAYVEFDGCGLRFLEEPARKPQADGTARVTVHVGVADVDMLHPKRGPARASLSPDRIEPMKDMPHGQREVKVRMPDGDRLNFGAAVT